MSTPTKRVTFSLFLITTLISFTGFIESQRAMQAAFKAWPGADFDYSGQSRDLLIALAFLGGTVSLCSRKATKVFLCLLAIPWGLATALGLLFLVRGSGTLDPRDGIFVVSLLLFAVSLWSAFRIRLNAIPLLSFGIVLNQLMSPRLFASQRRAVFAAPSPWSVSRDSWWHLAIFALSGLLFLWAIRLLYEEWNNPQIRSMEAQLSLKRPGIGLVFYSLNLAWFVLVGYLSSSLHVFGLTPSQVQLDPHLQFREMLLAKVPMMRWYSTIRREELRIAPEHTVWFSPDGHSVAFLKPHSTTSGTKWTVVHDGVEDPSFEEIGELAFGSTGSRLAYTARDGKAWSVFWDGRKGPAFESISGLRWIRQGTEITYEGRTSPNWENASIVVGNRVWPPGVFYQSYVDDSGAFGTVQTKEGVTSAVLDGTVIFKCEKNAELLVWWRQREFACIESHNHKQVVIFHGRPGPAVDQIVHVDGPVISSDGNEIGYRAENDGKEFVVVGERILPFGSCSNSVFGAGGRSAYLGCSSQGSFLVVDGEPGPTFQNGSIPQFSPDGKLVAYAAGEQARSFYVVNGRKGLEFDSVNYRAEFAPESNNFAYIAWRGTLALVVVGDLPGPEFDSVGDPVFSSDGLKVAYRARLRLRQFIVAGNKRGPTFDWVSMPVFSPDGRKVAYAASEGRELWLKVLDVP